MIEYPFKQGTPEWAECRRGVITASRAKDIRRTDGLTDQQRLYVEAMRAGYGEASARQAAGYKAKPTSTTVEAALNGTLVLQFGEGAHTYAKQLARELCGGKEPEGFEGLSQRTGHEEEPFAAIEYVARTGRNVEEAFFTATDDRKFGMSLDRWVSKDRNAELDHRKAALEIKTMVSSTTLFKAMVDGDISEYRDQCVFGLWLLTLDWIDLCLWCPDLQALHIVRINRDEEEIQRLEDDLMAFAALVSGYEAKLLRAMGRAPAAPAVEPTAPAVPRAAVPLAEPTF